MSTLSDDLWCSCTMCSDCLLLLILRFHCFKLMSRLLVCCSLPWPPCLYTTRCKYSLTGMVLDKKLACSVGFMLLSLWGNALCAITVMHCISCTYVTDLMYDIGYKLTQIRPRSCKYNFHCLGYMKKLLRFTTVYTSTAYVILSLPVNYNDARWFVGF